MIAGALHDQARRLQRIALIIGVLATALCIVGAVFDPPQFFHAYLFAWLFIMGLSLGGLALVMIHRLTGGAWGFLIGRLNEAQMKTLPLVAALFVPVMIGLPFIYAWATPSAQAVDMHPSAWNRFLVPQYFGLRAVIYFVAWIALAVFMSGWSRRQDEAADVPTFWRAYKVSGFGLVVIGVTLHFAAIDWLMSLQPGFTSTIFGPLLFSSSLLSAFSLSVLLFCLISDRPVFDALVSSKVFNDLGSLMYTFLALWAYLAWFQFMLIWLADLPRGNIWYLIRWHGGWRWLAIYIIVVHFTLPFLLLLFRAVKQNRARLGSVSVIVFVGQLIFMYYQVMPNFVETNLLRHWMDILLPLGLGGLWIAAFLWLVALRPLVPVHDLNRDQAIRLRQRDLEELARDEVIAHG
jgi:hypothetical protein